MYEIVGNCSENVTLEIYCNNVFSCKENIQGLPDFWETWYLFLRVDTLGIYTKREKALQWECKSLIYKLKSWIEVASTSKIQCII